MKYSYSKDIGLSFEEAEIKVRAALLDIGFGLLNAAYESIN
tara:strand:+ start:176 stop:298 length:123 start_codon:yes stop_codon:yes gene_type:complete